MDHSLLKQVVAELAEMLPGARVDKVLQAQDGSLLLSLNRSSKRMVLVLSPDRALPRLHLVSHRQEGTDRPAGFSLQLRKHLTGSRIKRIGTVNDDRVVDLAFAKDGVSLRLVFELFGPAPNLVLADRADSIISVLIPLPPNDRGGRVLLPGVRYALPAPPKGAGAGFRDAGDMQPFEQGTANEQAERLYAGILAERRTAALRRELERALRRAAVRTERRIRAVEQDLDQAERAEEHRLRGELILSNLQVLRQGMASASLVAPDGSPVTVPLDPEKGPSENAEACFRRYKKAKAARAVVRERLEDAREESEMLRLAQEELAQAAEEERLEALRSRFQRLGLISGGAAQGRAKASAPASPYRSVMIEGWEVLVGTSAAGNDYLTVKLARPDDLWLHAEGIPGSHVVVRNPGRRDVPPSVLKRAASLAAWHSKGRGSTKVAVAYTSAKYVRKPRGAKPGTVVLAERRTIMAVPEPFS